MTKQDVVKIEGKKAYCEGDNGILGHPGVYLDMSDNKEVICPYCSRHFIRK